MRTPAGSDERAWCGVHVKGVGENCYPIAPPPSPLTFAERLKWAIERTRFTVSNEREIQAALYQLLQATDLLTFPEHTFPGLRDRIDFFFPLYGVGLEMKVGTSGGSPAKVFEQLQRYAEQPTVNVLILATPSGRMLSRLPSEIGGKPCLRALLHMGL